MSGQAPVSRLGAGDFTTGFQSFKECTTAASGSWSLVETFLKLYSFGGRRLWVLGEQASKGNKQELGLHSGKKDGQS